MPILFLRMSSSSSTSVRRPWTLTILGLIAAGILMAMPIAAGGSAPSAMPDLARFLGRFHPLLLHLPIGVFAWIVVQEIVAMFRGRRDEPTPVGPFLFGAASAVVAASAGFLLYLSEDYGGGELLERHLWGGIAFAITAVATTVVKAWNVALGRAAMTDRALLVVAMGVMTVASHDGASITHGSDYLTRHAPAPLRALMGFQEDGEIVWRRTVGCGSGGPCRDHCADS